MEDLPPDLFPRTLRNYRQIRYQGDSSCLPMAEFTPEDQRTILYLYRFLLLLYETLNADDPYTDENIVQAKGLLSEEQIRLLTERTENFGEQSLAQNPSALMAQTIHDIRGGALSMIVTQSQLLSLCGSQALNLRLIFLRVRDHLKVMRNALIGLDAKKRAEDLLVKRHGMDLLLEKWCFAHYQGPNKHIRLEVDCAFSGAVSESSLEFSALDRILYNLIDNACRHSALDRVRLLISPQPNAVDPENIRLVLINEITPEEVQMLQQRDIRELFRPGVSTTGSGLGLAIVARFVADAFGVPSPELALKRRYLGAKVWRSRFVIWFHWPIVPKLALPRLVRATETELNLPMEGCAG